LLEKSGTWISFGGERMGQGRENARVFLKENKDIRDKLETALRKKLESRCLLTRAQHRPASTATLLRQPHRPAATKGRSSRCIVGGCQTPVSIGENRT